MQLAQADETFAVIDGVLCDWEDAQCSSAASHRAATARQTQTLLRAERRQAERDERTHGLLYELGQADADDARTGFWCFEGRHQGEAFGQCANDRESCLMLMGRRVEAGLRGTADCESYALAACFSVTRSLKRGSEPYCFPAIDQCERSRAAAVSRRFETVSDCRVGD